MESLSPDDSVFELPKGRKGAEMMRRDLAGTGDPETNIEPIPYRDAQGRYADFHALRHSYITNIIRAGVSPKVAQTLARHSTITLTMDRYAHIALESQVDAVNRLPDVLGAV